MLCAAIDIGSNTTRVLVGEPEDGQLRKVMEQRAYTRINKGLRKKDGAITQEKIEEVCDVVATQVRLAQEVGAEEIRIVATAAIREAPNGEKAAKAIGKSAGFPVEILSEKEEGTLAFIGATKGLAHPVEGEIAVVDVGGGSSEVVLGTLADGVREVKSFKVGSGRARRGVPQERSARGRRRSAACGTRSPTGSRASSSGSPSRRSPSAAAPPPCAASSARSSSTRRSSAASASSPATPPPRSPSASSSTSAGSRSSPPASSSSSSSPSSSASRCRSARAAFARA